MYFEFWFLESWHFFTNQILENSLVMGTIPFWHRTRECLNFQIVPFLLYFDGENWSRSKIKMKELLSGGVRLYKSTKVNFLPLRQKPLKTKEVCNRGVACSLLATPSITKFLTQNSSELFQWSQWMYSLILASDLFN